MWWRCAGAAVGTTSSSSTCSAGRHCRQAAPRAPLAPVGVRGRECAARLPGEARGASEASPAVANKDKRGEARGASEASPAVANKDKRGEARGASEASPAVANKDKRGEARGASEASPAVANKDKRGEARGASEASPAVANKDKRGEARGASEASPAVANKDKRSERRGAVPGRAVRPAGRHRRSWPAGAGGDRGPLARRRGGRGRAWADRRARRAGGGRPVRLPGADRWGAAGGPPRAGGDPAPGVRRRLACRRRAGVDHRRVGPARRGLRGRVRVRVRGR